MGKKSAATFSNRPFHYTGSVNSNLVIFPMNDDGVETGTKVNIDADTISYIKTRIREKLDVKMGACRDNPRKNSLGEYLLGRNKSPQYLSYVLPLLEEERYLKHYRAGRTIRVKFTQNP